MQHLRQLCAAAALVFALTFSTFAGDMHYPVAPQPTPTPESITTEESGTAAAPTQGTAQGEAGPAEVIVDIMFSLLQGVIILI